MKHRDIIEALPPIQAAFWLTFETEEGQRRETELEAAENAYWKAEKPEERERIENRILDLRDEREQTLEKWMQTLCEMKGIYNPMSEWRYQGMDDFGRHRFKSIHWYGGGPIWAEVEAVNEIEAWEKLKPIKLKPDEARVIPWVRVKRKEVSE